MNDTEKENVIAFEVEYTIYVDIMHSQVRPTDVIVETEEVNDE